MVAPSRGWARPVRPDTVAESSPPRWTDVRHPRTTDTSEGIRAVTARPSPALPELIAMTVAVLAAGTAGVAPALGARRQVTARPAASSADRDPASV